MKILLLKRGLGFVIDYLIIAFYALALFGATSLIELEALNPIEGQIVGFSTLTLPVFLYFYLSERGKYKATIGKRIMSISVVSGQKIVEGNVLLRNFLKFLPWEIAHFGVHWIRYYSQVIDSPPSWVWAALILPQIIVLGYIVSLFFYKGEYTWYDKIANTKVEIN